MTATSVGTKVLVGYQMFNPTSDFIAFVKSANSSEKDVTAQVYVARAQASAPTRALTRANTLVNDTTVPSGARNNMPTWAPTDDDGIQWVAFTSAR